MNSKFLFFLFATIFTLLSTSITTTTAAFNFFSDEETPCDTKKYQKMKSNDDSINSPTNQNSSISCTPTTNCPRLSQCYESFCICWMGYEWNPNGGGACQPHHCSSDPDCFSFYPHTRCVDAVCVCDDVSRFCPINQACVYLPDAAHYMIAIFAMAGGFLLVSVAATAATYWWTKRKYNRKTGRGRGETGQSGSLVKGTAVPNYQTISTVKAHYPEI